MAKTQILDYYIHLTDKATVDRYNDQLAAIGTVTASPNGVGSPLLFIPSTGKYAILRAPDGAATEFSAPKQAENVTFSAPCTRSHWFIPGTNNFPTNVATFTRKSGGWFGISGLFGKTTKFYWAGHFLYARSDESVVDGSGVVVSKPSLSPVRRWMDGFEMPAGGEGATYSNNPPTTPDAARLADGGFGFRLRAREANIQNVRHQLTTTPAVHTSWERFYVRVRTLPTTTKQIWRCENLSQSGSGFSIYLQPSGQLAFFSSPSGGNGDLVGTGGLLTLNTWARIDCLILFKGIAGVPDQNYAQLEVYLNGTRVGQFSMTPAGLVGNVKHIDSFVGRNQAEAWNAEVDFDDWINANIPSNMNTLNADWLDATAYAIGDIVNWDPATPLGFGIRLPSNVRGLAYVAKTANTNKQPDLNATEWAKLGDAPDWLMGSHLVTIWPAGDASDRSADWVGTFRIAMQRPHGGFDEQITSTVSGARLSFTTNAPDVCAGPRGAHSLRGFVQASYSNKAVVAGAAGSIGYRLQGAAAVMTPYGFQVDPPNDNWSSAHLVAPVIPAWTSTTAYVAGNPVLHKGRIYWCIAASTGNEPPNTAFWAVFPTIDLIHDRDTGAGTASVKGLHAVAEVLGIFGPEDVPAGTIDQPTFPVLRTGIHNRWYSRSPWAQNTSRGHSPVIIVGGTYVGNGIGSDLTFRVPPQLFFVRKVLASSRTVHWWSTMLGSHVDFAQAMQPGSPVFAEADPTFVPVGGEDDQAQRYRVRLLADDVVNASGATYQYVAVCDPAARFMLCGAFSHDDTAGYPITDALADPNFTARAGFVWGVDLTLTTTNRAWFKGIGHAANQAVLLLSGVLTNALSFGAGTLTVRSDIGAAADLTHESYAFFRTEDGNLDPDAKNVLGLLSWTGDGAASRTLAFPNAPSVRPLYAIVVGDSGGVMVHRDPSHTGTNSTTRITNSDIATGITAGDIGSMTVGSTLNANGTLYNAIVLWGGTVAGNNGWSQNGEFIPVEPESNKPPAWAEPEERIISFAPPPSGTAAGDGDGPTLDPPVLSDDLADTACVAPTTSIVNLALARIGVNKPIVTLLSELTPEAAAVRLAYDLSLQATLRAHPWPFATRYATLTLLAGSAGAPVSQDWTYAYRLPDNCLFPRRLVVTRGTAVNPTPPPCREGGGVLFANEASARLEYTARPHCPASAGDATFRSAWAWRLAQELAPALSRMADRAAYCKAQYEADLETARTFLRLGSPGLRPAADPNDPDASCAAGKLQLINLGLIRIGAQTIADLANEQSREAVSARLVYEDELKATLRDFAWPFATRYEKPLTLVRGPAWTGATVQAWSSTVAYVVGDTVKQAGTVYYCLLAHTNQQPPNATYWTTTPTTDANADWTYAYRTPTASIFARRLVRPGFGRRFDPNPPMYRLGADATGGLVFSDQQDAVLEYTIRPTCAVMFADPLFRDAFAWRMAAALAPSVAMPDPEAPEQTGQAPATTPKRSESGVLRLQQLREARARFARAMYQQALAVAAAASANEQQPERPDKGDADWIAGR